MVSADTLVDPQREAAERMRGIESRNLVDGAWVTSSSGRTVPVTDPATDEPLATVQLCSAEDVRRAIDAAAQAYPAWAATTAHHRSTTLGRLADLVEARTERLATIISLESGKPLAEASAEVAYGHGFLQWAAEEAKRVYGDMVPASAPDKRILVLRQPVGVTAAITPWNFPFAMLTRKLGPALAVGCTQIVKPATLTPLTAIALGELALEAGLPPGTLNIVTGSGQLFADALFSDTRVRKVSFTGSTEVGMDLVRRSAGHLPRLSLELGGHAPFIVFADADIPAAVQGAVHAKFRNGGQSCIAANRMYVAAAVYEEFREGLVKAVDDLRLGAAFDGESDVGPLIDDEAVAKAQGHVQDAMKRGARALAGGRTRDLGPARSGRFFAPTVLDGVNRDMLVSTEETFGPVAPLTLFHEIDEVLAAANLSPYGLAGYVFTRDLATALLAAERLDCGVVGVNDGLPSASQAPFGGIKLSGVGREGGRYGMDAYLEMKYVSLRLMAIR